MHLQPNPSLWSALLIPSTQQLNRQHWNHTLTWPPWYQASNCLLSILFPEYWSKALTVSECKTSLCVLRFCFLHLGWREGLTYGPLAVWSWCFWRWGAAWPRQRRCPGNPVSPWGPWPGAKVQKMEGKRLKHHSFLKISALAQTDLAW